jgi:hypothetical protein
MAEISPPDRETIIRRGLLPENLPPVVSSDGLWNLYSALDASYLTTTKSVGSLSSFNASKRGGNRRIFNFPHPNFVFDQATYFETHWPDLEKVFDSSPGSLSKPITSGGPRRAIRITPHSELPKLRLSALSRFKFCVFTDVARCFPSIYTHSIPWAINGKAKAKSDFSANSSVVHGNRLDFLFRQGQQQQTIGIPVGPDTSRLTFDYVARVISWRCRIGEKVDSALWGEVIRNVCHQSAIFGRDAEAMWALWLMKELKLKVSKTLSDAVIGNNSAIVCGFLAHLHANGLTSDGKISEKFWDNVEGDIFSGPDWPLSLELMHLEIAKPSGQVEKAHASLRNLHEAKASLINWDASPPVFSTSVTEDEPDQAIEDFSSEYDGDGDEDEDEFDIPM